MTLGLSSLLNLSLPLTYTVKPGDGLFAICQSQAPDIPIEDCLAQAVEINALADANQLTVGQELLMPVPGTDEDPVYDQFIQHRLDAWSIGRTLG